MKFNLCKDIYNIELICLSQTGFLWPWIVCKSYFYYEADKIYDNELLNLYYERKIFTKNNIEWLVIGIRMTFISGSQMEVIQDHYYIKE